MLSSVYEFISNWIMWNDTETFDRIQQKYKCWGVEIHFRCWFPSVAMANWAPPSSSFCYFEIHLMRMLQWYFAQLNIDVTVSNILKTQSCARLTRNSPKTTKHRTRHFLLKIRSIDGSDHRTCNNISCHLGFDLQRRSDLLLTLITFATKKTWLAVFKYDSILIVMILDAKKNSFC